MDQNIKKIVSEFFATVNASEFCEQYGINKINLSLFRNGKFKGNEKKFISNLFYCMNKYSENSLILVSSFKQCMDTIAENENNSKKIIG